MVSYWLTSCTRDMLTKMWATKHGLSELIAGINIIGWICVFIPFSLIYGKGWTIHYIYSIVLSLWTSSIYLPEVRQCTTMFCLHLQKLSGTHVFIMSWVVQGKPWTKQGLIFCETPRVQQRSHAVLLQPVGRSQGGLFPSWFWVSYLL